MTRKILTAIVEGTCEKCPECQRPRDYFDCPNSYCNLDDNCRDVGQGDKLLFPIPAWCPLPDAPDNKAREEPL